VARAILGGRGRGIGEVVRHTGRLDGCGQAAAWGRGGEGMSLERVWDGSEMGRA
jgi:hypothetical protein